ncbi:MAG: AAA family ATPase [Salinivenus sp.]
MKISRLQVQNFKSFDTVDVELGDFNVLIGANASGKSNFLSILTFLRDIARDGLKDAVSMQSGEIELLRNVQLGRERPTEIRVEVGHGLDDPGSVPDFDWGAGVGPDSVKLSGFYYEIGLRHEESDFRIGREEATWAGYFQKESSDQRVFDVQSNSRESPYSEWDSHSPNGTLFTSSEDSKTSLLQVESHGLWTTFTREVFSSLRIFDFGTGRFDTGISSQKGKSQLEENGQNVALVLRNLLKNPERRRKFLNLATVLLPFVEDADVDRFAGESLLMKLQEAHSGDRYLPASLLSEGTVKVVSLIIALYFENIWVGAFEEPATSLHPKLISQLMQMMTEVSEEKQIFITTHNPEVIKHVDLGDVYLVSRDDDGFSQISKPGDKTEVRTFLKNDLGIDDLFVQNLL